MDTSAKTSVSVLICTYNRHELLHQAMTALVDHTDEKPDEIVVVNGGDEQADEVVESFYGKYGIDIKLLKTVNINAATSRNIGIEHCTGDIVAITDDDGKVFPDWISQIRRIHMEQPDAVAVGGSVLGINSEYNLLSRVADVVTFPLPKEATDEIRTIPFVNATYKREILNVVGKLDETLVCGEDVDFNWRIKRKGYRIFFHPDIQVLHHHRPSLRGMIRQHYMYGRGYYLVRAKWKDIYSVLPGELKTAKDWLKGLHFFVNVIYKPLLQAFALQRWQDRILALPVMYALYITWKIGIVYQGWLAYRTSE
jgi:GT2 family glycosyltransferase